MVSLRKYLKEQKVKYLSTKGYVYINISSETPFSGAQQKEAVPPLNAPEALLYILKLHQILFFLKEETDITMNIQCIDTNEIKKVTEICIFYGIKFEIVGTKFELKLSKQFDFNLITSKKVEGIEATDPKKFSKELIDSIYAVDYELAKQKVLVTLPPERLVKDVTRSTRYAMVNTRKSITFIANFSKYMMSVYGVDVLQDPIDEHTFFVIGPKNAEFSNSSNENANREARKIRSSVHPVSKLLLNSGIKCYSTNDKDGLSFTLRFDEQKNPKNITFHSTDEKEKKEVIKKSLLLLKGNGYQVELSQAKKRIVFLSPEQKITDSREVAGLLKKSGFTTRKNGVNKTPGFSISFFSGTKNVSSITFIGGKEEERREVAEKARLLLEEHGLHFNRKHNSSKMVFIEKQTNGVQGVDQRTVSIDPVQVKHTDQFFLSLSENQIDLLLQNISPEYIKQRIQKALKGFVVIRENDATLLRPELFISLDELIIE